MREVCTGEPAPTRPGLSLPLLRMGTQPLLQCGMALPGCTSSGHFWLVAVCPPGSLIVATGVSFSGGGQLAAKESMRLSGVAAGVSSSVLGNVRQGTVLLGSASDLHFDWP